MPSSTSSFNRSIRFPLRVGLAACLILAGYDVFVVVARPDFVVSYDAQTHNRIVAERYVDGGTHEAVLVGSSMSGILSREYMRADSLGPDIYNLALLGGHSATGLDIVIRKGEWPRVVLIEMNVMDRGYDPGFAGEGFAEPGRAIRHVLPAFRLEYRPFDLATVALWQFARDRIAGRASPPSSAPTKSPSIDDRPPDAPYRAEIAASLRTIDDQIAVLRAHAVRIVLVHLPVDSAIEREPRTQYLWEQTYAAFPLDRYDWLEFDKSGSYEIPDGVHLSIASARRVAAELRKAAAAGDRR